MHASYLLDVRLMFARRLLDVCSTFARSCKLGITLFVSHLCSLLKPLNGFRDTVLGFNDTLC